MSLIPQRIQQLNDNIDQLSMQFKHKPRLIAVSKTYPVEVIEQAYYAGQRAFGENYVQELSDKAEALKKLKEIEWHFIGKIQSNKTKLIAKYATWVHTITKLEHAQRLDRQRSNEYPPLQVLIEVNISQEQSKGGVETWEQLRELACEIAKLPRLKLRGLMGMASNSSDHTLILNQFNSLANYLKQLNKIEDLNLDQLSIGMSNDYQLAIESGSTMVRIGSRIFGERNYVK